MYLPSGESSAAAISGLPKITSRSISGGGTPALSPFAVAMDASRRIHTKPNESFIRGSSFLLALGTRAGIESKYSDILLQPGRTCKQVSGHCIAFPAQESAK